jgi:hypothetical protein
MGKRNVVKCRKQENRFVRKADKGLINFKRKAVNRGK